MTDIIVEFDEIIIRKRLDDVPPLSICVADPGDIGEVEYKVCQQLLVRGDIPDGFHIDRQMLDFAITDQK